VKDQRPLDFYSLISGRERGEELVVEKIRKLRRF